MTLSSPSKTQLTGLGNATLLEYQSKLNLSLALTGQKCIRFPTPKQKGDWGERFVALMAEARGATVTEHPNNACPWDLHLKYNGKEIYIDVKWARKKASRGPFAQYGSVGSHTDKKSKDRQKENIWIVMIHPETLHIRWINNNYPPDWEDFWNKYEIID